MYFLRIGIVLWTIIWSIPGFALAPQSVLHEPAFPLQQQARLLVAQVQQLEQGTNAAINWSLATSEQALNQALNEWLQQVLLGQFQSIHNEEGGVVWQSMSEQAAQQWGLVLDQINQFYKGSQFTISGALAAVLQKFLQHYAEQIAPEANVLAKALYELQEKAELPEMILNKRVHRRRVQRMRLADVKAKALDWSGVPSTWNGLEKALKRYLALLESKGQRNAAWENQFKQQLRALTAVEGGEEQLKRLVGHWAPKQSVKRSKGDDFWLSLWDEWAKFLRLENPGLVFWKQEVINRRLSLEQSTGPFSKDFVAHMTDILNARQVLLGKTTFPIFVANMYVHHAIDKGIRSRDAGNMRRLCIGWITHSMGQAMVGEWIVTAMASVRLHSNSVFRLVNQMFLLAQMEQDAKELQQKRLVKKLKKKMVSHRKWIQLALLNQSKSIALYHQLWMTCREGREKFKKGQAGKEIRKLHRSVKNSMITWLQSYAFWMKALPMDKTSLDTVLQERHLLLGWIERYRREGLLEGAVGRQLQDVLTGCDRFLESYVAAPKKERCGRYFDWQMAVGEQSGPRGAEYRQNVFIQELDRHWDVSGLDYWLWLISLIEGVSEDQVLTGPTMAQVAKALALMGQENLRGEYKHLSDKQRDTYWQRWEAIADHWADADFYDEQSDQLKAVLDKRKKATKQPWYKKLFSRDKKKPSAEQGIVWEDLFSSKTKRNPLAEQEEMTWEDEFGEFHEEYTAFKLPLNPVYDQRGHYQEQGPQSLGRQVLPISWQTDSIAALKDKVEQQRGPIVFYVVEDQQREQKMSAVVMTNGKDVFISATFLEFLRAFGEDGRLFLEHMLREELYELYHQIKGSPYVVQQGQQVVDPQSERFRGEVASTRFALLSGGYSVQALEAFYRIADAWYSEQELRHTGLSESARQQLQRLARLYQRLAAMSWSGVMTLEEAPQSIAPELLVELDIDRIEDLDQMLAAITLQQYAA